MEDETLVPILRRPTESNRDQGRHPHANLPELRESRMNEKAEKLKRVVESDPDSFIFASIDGDRVSTVLDLDAKMARHNYINSMAGLILAIDNHGPMSAEEVIYHLANAVEENRDSPSIATGGHDG